MSNQGNGGLYSKFQERLRRMRIFRSKTNREKNNLFIQDKVKEIQTVIRNDPTPVRVSKNKVSGEKNYLGEDLEKETVISKEVVSIRKSSKDRNYNQKKVGPSEGKPISKFLHELEKETPKQAYLGEKQEKFSSLDKKTPLTQSKKIMEKNKPQLRTNRKTYDYQADIKDTIVQIPEEEKVQIIKKMGCEIIEKIKSNFEDRLDELEVLESELYFIKQDQENEVELKKVKEIKERIQKLIEEANQIIEQYNLYNKNYYIDHVVGIDDHVLVDEIIDYRFLLDSLSEEKKFVKEYKMLDEFHRLYGHLKSMRDETEQLVLENEDKIEEYEIRDEKYHQIKLEALQVNDMNQKCSLEVARQNEYFDTLMSKISKIDREEYTTYHLRGIGELLNESIRYMGLMLASPFRGLLPGIALQTMYTRRMIGNIYRHLNVEEVNHVHYEAVNYEAELNHHLFDVDYTSSMLEDALRDIGRLREEFMGQYDSRIPGYEDTLKKLEKIENQVVHNQNRVDIIRTNLKKSKKLNEDKLTRVKRLNEE